MIASCILIACARDSGRQTSESDRGVDVLASRLSTEAELARYATLCTAGANTRDLGRKMSAAVKPQAMTEHILLPAVLTESDRQLVRRLESLNGDDFDVAFAAWAADQPRQIGLR